jgi:hypothetical protein
MRTLVTLLIGIFLFSGCTEDDPVSDNCGDGVVDVGENCDGNQLLGNTCENNGFNEGIITCSSECNLITTGCSGKCGDGILQDVEQCDGDPNASDTCISLGHHGGILACTSQCQFDTSQCLSCGDGIIQETYEEECDGESLNNTTCVSLGRNGGTLGCNASCKFDRSLCEGECGNNIKEAGEECDGSVSSDDSCINADFWWGEPTCNTDCSFNYDACEERFTFSDSTENKLLGSANDSMGNLYVTGYAWGGFNGELGKGGYDCILVKINADGQEEWTQIIGTSDNDECWEVAVDENDNPVVVGASGGGFPKHDHSPDSNGNFLNSGGLDFLVVQLTSDGTIMLTHQWGGIGDDRIKGLAISSSYYHMVGETNGGYIVPSGDSVSDVYFAKYDSNLQSFQWMNEYSSSNATIYDLAQSIAVLPSGSVVFVGCTGGDIAGTINGVSDPFIFLINSVGNHVYSDQSFGTNSAPGTWECALDVVADPLTEDAYITGYVQSAVDGETYVASSDFFVARYNFEIGNMGRTWTRIYGSGIMDEGSAITIGNDENLYVGARYNAAIGAVNNEGDWDMVLHSYQKDGTHRWAKNWGTSEVDQVLNMSIDPLGHIYLVGYSEGDFGNSGGNGANGAIVRTLEE